MLIGNKIFPYPLLNRNSNFSEYKPTSSFVLRFVTTPDGQPIIDAGNIVFKNLCFELKNDTLNELLTQGKVKGCFIVECSASTYRRNYDISTVPYDLQIPVKALNGNVVVSCFLYATEDIFGFKSNDFVDEYKDYSFDIDKFDILAADDGFKFPIDMDKGKDDKVASIFSIVKSDDTNNVMKYINHESHITIQLSPEYYACYERIKTKSEYNNVAFAMIALPVLAACIEELRTDEFENSIEDIIEKKPWFNAVCISYKRETGNEITYDDFESINSLELAQLVFNHATCEGIKSFDSFLMGTAERNDEEDE